MAQKFGGAHSPAGHADDTAPAAQNSNKFRGRKVHKSDMRSKLLFALPLPLLFSGIGEMRAQNAGGMLAEFGALAVLLLAAWLLRDGLRAQQAYDSRKIARPPAIPRKMFASALTGLGVFIAAAFGMKAGIPAAIAYAAIATGAHTFSFGIDPLRKKGMAGLSDFETERVAKAVDKAETLLTEMVAAARRIGDRGIERRVDALAASVRDMFRTVEDDPRDLSGARKFLGVYLRGARDATLKYADLASKTSDAEAKAKYESLLSDLEASFNTQRETMMLDNRTDLDVEIEVLRDRLKQEGLKAS
ncbi:5-bromo-4-chloroindolyl phosphate hydrolysis family protein [Neptunicoccus sediminis]|uniref:5-bromo-4-chloroindolyl phosphate hydrolysis family protein n=1 Tax=Neptunicoccus sediminis TaxID=1892596 RepID=UPI000845E50E|nr:5-bromo-4-chloroindolyl phosphate hydrolysis family protein [Neptunicoccus sediminis]